MAEIEHWIEEGALVRCGPDDLIGCVIRSYISADLKKGHMCQVLWSNGSITSISSLALESIDKS